MSGRINNEFTYQHDDSFPKHQSKRDVSLRNGGFKIKNPIESTAWTLNGIGVLERFPGICITEETTLKGVTDPGRTDPDTENSQSEVQDGETPV